MDTKQAEILLIQLLKDVSRIGEKILSLPTKLEVEEMLADKLVNHTNSCQAVQTHRQSRRLIWAAIGAIVTAGGTALAAKFF
jgi:hypothetical protein